MWRCFTAQYCACPTCVHVAEMCTQPSEHKGREGTLEAVNLSQTWRGITSVRLSQAWQPRMLTTRTHAHPTCGAGATRTSLPNRAPLSSRHACIHEDPMLALAFPLSSSVDAASRCRFAGRAAAVGWLARLLAVCAGWFALLWLGVLLCVGVSAFDAVAEIGDLLAEVVFQVGVSFVARGVLEVAAGFFEKNDEIER